MPEYKYFSLPDPEEPLSPLSPVSVEEYERAQNRQRTRKKWIFAIVIIITVAVMVCATIIVFIRLFENFSHTYPQPVSGYNGAVATEHKTCSQIGIDIMKSGGNAVDSAIAAALCVGTLNCFSSGIGGGGFMIIRDQNGEYHGINFREMAPGASTKEMFVKDPHLAEEGGLSVAVPGEIKGFYEAHSRFGLLEWQKLFEPSIKLAREGFPVTPVMYSRLKEEEANIGKWPGFNETFMRNGEIVRVGDVIYRENYAKALEMISIDAKSFYKGDIADDLIATVRESGGIMTNTDLEQYNVKFEKPLVGFYRGRKVITSNAPASGAILLSILNLMERYDLHGEGSLALNVHRLIEAFKFAYAQRTDLGDPDFVDIRERIQEIISKEEAYKLRKNLTDETTHPYQYYNPHFEPIENHGTTHLSTLDKSQMAVAMTSTINLNFGSKVMTRKFGIILNDHMDDFSTPNKTNAFGLRPTKNNFIQPGKRPLSSTVPTIVEDNGDVELVIGASGGSKITTAVSQVILNIFDHGMNVQTAISSRRVHHQLLPDVVKVENGVEHAIVDELRKRNHQIIVLPRGEGLADVQAVARLSNGKIQAGSDYRKGGYAAAF